MIQWTIARVFGMLALLFVACIGMNAEERPQVELSAEQTAPRNLESLTGQAIVRDYGRAWNNMAIAFDSDSSGLLNGYFAGNAKSWLTDAIADQKKTGVHLRYLHQRHQLKPVFYAPEGDVIELHDTAQCEVQLLDGAKVIHGETVTLHYVVLMTPAADRWMVRQLQAVPDF